MAMLSTDELHDPAMQITFAIVVGIILLIAVTLIIRNRLRRRERERAGQHPQGPWWRGPNAPQGTDPVIPRHGDQSGGGA